MKKLMIGLNMLLLLLWAPFPSRADAAKTAEAKGLQIAMEADRRDEGFGDFTADLLMVLKNKQGQTSERAIRIRTLEVANDGDKSLSIFDTPRDVKGTAFLNYTHKASDDDQWMYLPALKRVKRINSRNKSGSFMGSEFAYEDIGSQEVEKYTYLWLKDEILDGRPCTVIERYPVDLKNSGYSRQVVWLDQQEYRVWRIEYYDRKNALLKTMTNSQYDQYLDKYWRPREVSMINHQSGKSTVLHWSQYAFKVGLTENDFNQNGLKRLR